MKKALSILTAAALAAGTIGTMTASAHQIDDGRFAYTEAKRPYTYLKINEGDGPVKLSDEFIYINRNKIPDEGEVIYVDVFLYDSTKKVSDIYIHLHEDTSSILMRNGYDPREKYGSTPFIKFNDPHEDMTTYIPPYGPVNCMSMNYSTTSLKMDYYVLAGENTDDYPMGCFDMVAPKDVKTGIYHVDHPKPASYHICKSTVSRFITDENDNYLYAEFYDLLHHCRNLQINVSDRDLGDLDANSDIDNLDAELLLKTYAQSENDGVKGNESLLIASDVNGDRVVDDLDAEMIMDYELLYGSEEQPELSFVDYVKQQIGEE